MFPGSVCMQHYVTLPVPAACLDACATPLHSPCPLSSHPPYRLLALAFFLTPAPAEGGLEDDFMGLGISGSKDATASRAYEDSFM